MDAGLNPIFTQFIFVSWLWIILNNLIADYTAVAPAAVFIANILLIVCSLRLIFVSSIYIVTIALCFITIAINNILFKASIIGEELYAIDIGVGFFLISFVWCFLSNNQKQSLPTMDHILTYLLLLALSVFSVSIAMDTSVFIYIVILVVFLLTSIYFLAHIPNSLSKSTRAWKILKWTCISATLLVATILRILLMYQLIDKRILSWAVLACFVALYVAETARVIYNTPRGFQPIDREEDI